jgi:YbbR-like protein
MTVRETITHNFRLKLLSLAAALLLWLFAGFGREQTATVPVPVELLNLPSAFQVAEPVPASVEVTVTGPKIRVTGLQGRGIRLHLDLAAVREGTVVFTALHRQVKTPAGVDVVRVQPAAIELRILRKTGA